MSDASATAKRKLAKLYPVSFAVAGLPPGGNVEIQIGSRNDDTFTLGVPNAAPGNGLAVRGGGGFSQIAFSPKEISIAGANPPTGGGGGGGTAGGIITIKSWIHTENPIVMGRVTLPSGATLTVDAGLGESGTISSSGSWSATVDEH
jgi:hypothetical protein